MRVAPGPGGGRLRRGSIFAKLKPGSTLRDTPGLAILSVPQGFNLDDHRDSSLYRRLRMSGDA